MKEVIQPALIFVAVLFGLPFQALAAQAPSQFAPANTNDRRSASRSTSGDTSRDTLLETYCYDCHSGAKPEGGMDLKKLFSTKVIAADLVFENLITGRMPPVDAEQPSAEEKKEMLAWIANRHQELPVNSFRRRSRHEFEYAVNDLLKINLGIADSIAEDRGTFDFDTDRRIQLTKESLGAYLIAADRMLEFGFPAAGFAQEQVWKTNRVKDSHQTYNIYVRNYLDGLLFSWTRANNGNAYSFFFDDFEPHVSGWYELSFDAAKVGEFPEAISILVYAGKYYFADDRPQTQRLLGVLSLDERKVTAHTIRAFLNPGENVSVHCYSKHNWRQKRGKQGAYIQQLNARGPVHEKWPPESFRKVFAGLELRTTKRTLKTIQPAVSKLKEIGGRISVSSFQVGMEKEKMLDGSNKSFWHTRFKPDVAKPPHFVIIENPNQHPVSGLSYSAWSGGNGNGQVKRFAIAFSDDGKNWSETVTEGDLEIQVAAAQEILFPNQTKKRFIRFLVKDAVSLDGKSLASIGKLDVITGSKADWRRTPINVVFDSSRDLEKVLKRFANRAFSTTLSDAELKPYLHVARGTLDRTGDFTKAAKQGIKALLCSHRFLLVPGEHLNDSYRRAADLARCLWLSVPDQRLLRLANTDSLTKENAATEIERMLKDARSDRMIHSFCNQWLNLRSFEKVSPSLKLYPLYDDLLDFYLPLETEAYVRHLIQQNLPVSSLLDSDFSFLNQRLAQHYGIKGVYGQNLRKVPLPADSPRGGLLTMGSVLTVTTDGFQTSPILRGAWISQNLIGNALAPPPESVAAIEATSREDVSLKEQIQNHKNQPSCYACHKQIDPYGFALESFDATGQQRTQYRVETPHSGTFQYRPQGYYRIAGKVDASGAIDEIEFKDINQLKRILLQEDRKVAYNFAKKFFQFATGIKPTMRQRIELFDLIPAKSEERLLRDLMVRVLVYAFIEEKNE